MKSPERDELLQYKFENLDQRTSFIKSCEEIDNILSPFYDYMKDNLDKWSHRHFEQKTIELRTKIAKERALIIAWERKQRNEMS